MVVRNLTNISHRNLEHVKKLCFVAPFRDNLKERCPHHQSLDVEGRRLEDWVKLGLDAKWADPVESFGRDVLSLLSLLKDDSLRGFRYVFS